MNTWIHVYDALAELRARAEKRERRRLGMPATEVARLLLAARRRPKYGDRPGEASADAERRNRASARRSPGEGSQWSALLRRHCPLSRAIRSRTASCFCSCRGILAIASCSSDNGQRKSRGPSCTGLGIQGCSMSSSKVRELIPNAAADWCLSRRSVGTADDRLLLCSVGRVIGKSAITLLMKATVMTLSTLSPACKRAGPVWRRSDLSAPNGADPNAMRCAGKRMWWRDHPGTQTSAPSGCDVQS